MSGSHGDSIILGGAYDGILGVLAPIVAVKALREAGFKPRKSIEVAQFTSEEGDRFTEVCFGRCALHWRTLLMLSSRQMFQTSAPWIVIASGMPCMAGLRCRATA